MGRFLAAGGSCLFGNRCAPGWSLNLPPITSPAGLVLAVIVAVVCGAIGAFFGGGGRQQLKNSRTGSVIGIIVLIAVVYWQH